MNTYNYLANERAIKRKKKAQRMLEQEQERAEYYKDLCKTCFAGGVIGGISVMVILLAIVYYVM